MNVPTILHLTALQIFFLKLVKKDLIKKTAYILRISRDVYANFFCTCKNLQ